MGGLLRMPLLPTSSLASDLLTVTDAVGTSTSKPIFWLAISMGGAIVSRALQMRPDAVAGIVLLAPMISLTKVCANSALLARCLIAAYIHTCLHSRPQSQPRPRPNQVREEYVVPALGIRNRHLRPVMHQISAWMPTLPVTSKKTDNTLHPHLEQERPVYTRIHPTYITSTTSTSVKHPFRCRHIVSRVWCMPHRSARQTSKTTTAAHAGASRPNLRL